MTPPLLPTLGVLLAAPLFLPRSPQLPWQEDESEAEPVVQLELLADAPSVAPGQKLLLAAVFRLPEHFHVYWENAGDAGLPTKVQVTGPEGFEIGAPRFPGPSRFELPGDLVSYGYEGEAVIFVPVKCPDRLDRTSSFLFELKAEWMVCREACFLQDGESSLRLRARPEGEKAKPANAALLRPFKERLPRPLEELEGSSVSLTAADGGFRLTVKVEPAADLEFFPLRGGPLELRARRLSSAAVSPLVLTVELSRIPGREAEPPSARGVLRVTTGGRDRYYSVRVVLAAEHRPGEAKSPRPPGRPTGLPPANRAEIHR